MRTENNLIHVSIGGVEYPVQVLYRDVERFLKGFNRILLKNKGVSGLKIPNTYFFDVLWGCLVKEGFLFWKKPFMTKRQMIKKLRYDEVADITMFISKHVLKFENDAADPESKKKQESL